MDENVFDEVVQKARNACYDLITTDTTNNCGILFDGIYCWEETPAGLLAHQSCSNSYIKSTKNATVERFCHLNGQWGNWTNNTQCGIYYINSFNNKTSETEMIYKNWIPIIKTVSQSGYTLSTISLIIALLIFINVKKLHCARNKLHMNLFASFILKALTSLVKDLVLVEGTAFPNDVTYENGNAVFEKEDYPWMCKALISFWHYTIISNYSFLLMEGVYLHNLLFLNSFSENNISIYCITGWGFPLLFVVPWVILRAFNEDNYCWTLRENRYINSLTQIPITLTVIINFILFSIVIKILFVKLNSMYVQQKWIKYQRLIRAILILVPLFGIPYMISLITSFYMKRNITFEIYWLFFDQTFGSCQGFFTSLVYCFFNNEVQVELTRKYRSFKDRHNRELKRRSRTISHTTQVALAEELQDFARNLGIRENNYKSSDYF